MALALALVLTTGSACGSGSGRAIDSCVEQPIINVSEVGQVVALAQFKEGYVVAGIRFGLGKAKEDIKGGGY